MLLYNKIADANYIYFNQINNVQNFLDDYMEIDSRLKNLFKNKARRSRQKSNYVKRVYDSTNILTFDTETTTTTVKSKDTRKPFAFTYVQMLNINGKVTILTRTITEFGQLLNSIDDWYSRKGLKKIKGFTSVLWAHNLSYDFQFLLNTTEIESTLSRKNHDVIYAIDANRCFQYRDSYSLLGVKLENATKDYGVKHQKLAGTFNYSLKRTPITPLNIQEEAYCINDVQGLSEIIQILVDSEGYGLVNGEFKGYSNFPNTKTGLVRDYIRLIIKDEKLEKERKKLFSRINTSPELYRLLKICYQGGYTHAFGYYKGKIVKNICSYDKTSDYPYQIVVRKYPMTTFVESNIKEFEEDAENDFENYAYLVTAKFSGNVRANSFITTMPKTKIERSVVNPVYDNGKLVSADEVIVKGTEKDFQIYCSLYDADNIEILELYRATKDYLPFWIIKGVFEFYKQKTQLKNVFGSEIEYQYYKQLLNSIYGCMVQDPAKNTFSCIDNVWEEYRIETDEDLEEALNKTKPITAYQWGVWVTAYARYELISVAMQIDDKDLLYADTDSLKFVFRPRYEKLFNRLNKEMTADNKRVARELHKMYPQLSYDDFIPVDKDGIHHELGLWDYEGTYSHFKSTGAKRYITTFYVKKYDKYVLHVTCCGIAKDKMADQLVEQANLKCTKVTDKEAKLKNDWLLSESEVKDVFDLFDDGFYVKPEYDKNGNSLTGKMTHAYFDTTIKNRVRKAKITDYKGNKCEIKQDYYITLFPADFTFNANRDEIEYLMEEE